MICAIGAFAYRTQYEVAKSRYWVMHTYTARSELQTVETELAKLRGNALSRAMWGGAGQLEQFRVHADRIASVTRELRELTADNPGQQTRLQDFEALSQEYAAKLNGMARVSWDQGRTSAKATGEVPGLDATESKMERAVNAMDEEERRLLDRRLADSDRLSKRNGVIFGITIIAAVVLLAYNFRLLTREVAGTKELERLQCEHAQGYRSLSARIMELQDTERRKVARELHDSVGQYLVALKISLEQLQASRAHLSDQDANVLADIINLSEHSISEVRTISHLLHPPLLDEVGFESAARWYAEGFAARCGMQVNMKLSKFDERLPKEVELTLFRVLQETLTNVHRHAEAQAIEIAANCADGKIVMTISDNGRGIPEETVRRYRSGLASGVGLAGMRERLGVKWPAGNKTRATWHGSASNNSSGAMQSAKRFSRGASLAWRSDSAARY